MKILNFIFIPVLGMIILTGCNTKESSVVVEEGAHHEASENEAVLTTAQMRTAGIVLGKVQRRPISGTIKVNGVLDVPPQQLISVSVPLGGFLKNTTLLQGSKVKKGQRIAVIENAEYIQIQQDYLEAKNQLEYTLADYERQQALAKENVNAQKTLQQAKSSYQTWLARKNGLLAKLKLIHVDIKALEEGHITSTGNVYSPIDGYVTEVNVNIGKFVSPTDVLFEIVDTEHLHAELTVFESDVPKIKIGQKVWFTLANETEPRTATVYLIGREIGEDRSIRIHCHIDKEDAEFLPGMYLKALVETGGAIVPALPDEAIISYLDKKYIFVPEAPHDEQGESEAHEHGDSEDHGVHETGEVQHFTMVEVQTGNSEMGYTEVELPENVHEDTEVVVKGAYAILSKMKNSEEEGGHHH